MSKTKPSFSNFILGMLTGIGLWHGTMNYHLLNTREGLYLIPKTTVEFSGAYIDSRGFDLEDWKAQPQLASAVLNAGKQHLLETAAQESLRPQVVEKMDRFEQGLANSLSRKRRALSKSQQTQSQQNQPQQAQSQQTQPLRSETAPRQKQLEKKHPSHTLLSLESQTANGRITPTPVAHPSGRLSRTVRPAPIRGNQPLQPNIPGRVLTKNPSERLPVAAATIRRFSRSLGQDGW